MVKKLIRHGNSLALVIDKPVLELLKITEETQLEIETLDGKTLHIRRLEGDTRSSFNSEGGARSDQ